MKKDDFVVQKSSTPFKMMCDEHEISYKDISLSSGVGYHTIAKAATSVVKPTEETLAKLNQVCEPIFGKTLTLEDFGFHPEPQVPAEESAGSTEPPMAEPKPAKKVTRKTTRKKGNRTKAKTASKTKPKEPEAEIGTVTIRVTVEYLSCGYVLRDSDGWSECFDINELLSRALMERIERAVEKDTGLGYQLEIKLKPVTDPFDFYHLKK